MALKFLDRFKRKLLIKPARNIKIPLSPRQQLEGPNRAWDVDFKLFKKRLLMNDRKYQALSSENKLISLSATK